LDKTARRLVLLMEPKANITSQSQETDIDVVSNDERLIRRINSKHHVIFDQNLGARRLSTKAFHASTDDKKMSVDLEQCIKNQGNDPAKYVTQPENIDGAVVFLAAIVRQKELEVECAPVPDNPCHGNVFKHPNLGRLNKKQENHLLANCEWLVAIPGVRLR